MKKILLKFPCQQQALTHIRLVFFLGKEIMFFFFCEIRNRVTVTIILHKLEFFT